MTWERVRALILRVMLAALMIGFVSAVMFLMYWMITNN